MTYFPMLFQENPSLSLSPLVCVCMCSQPVEREREREKEGLQKVQTRKYGEDEEKKIFLSSCNTDSEKEGGNVAVDASHTLWNEQLL
jgi:hypothetical protein